MKVQGMTNPGRFTVEQVPGTNKSLIRLFQNAKTIETEDFTGYEYDEYRVEVETWDGIFASVEANYDVFLQKGMEAEIDKSNEALYRAESDLDAMTVDHELRIMDLELGISEEGE